MKKALLMASIFIFPRLLVAQDYDIDSMLGETWYGLYLNGEKAGYACNRVEKNDAGNAVLIEDARFRINMAGARQDMHIYSERTYARTGDLLSIESRVVDPVQLTEFIATIEGDELRLKTVIGGVTKEETLPKPKESLADGLKHAEWVRSGPSIGDELSFYVFEPMYKKEIAGVSRIRAIEKRVLDGVSTKVYEVKTTLDPMGVESVARVAEDGTTLEDVVAQIIHMRLEPEAIAKDVNYSNDVIVSNAAMIATPLENPRGRDELRLLLRGPLEVEHLYNDNRQRLAQEGDHFIFTAKRLSPEDLSPVHLPLAPDAKMEEWLKPTVFVQSDHPRLIEKAREIAGGESGALEVTRKLCGWVNRNMRSTFSARLTNSLEVLDNLEGDCTEHSILFIGLARAAGLPAREVAGLIYVEETQPGFYFHQWAKVWVGQWVDVDPTFDQAFADVTHIKLAEGDLFEQARLIPIIGNLRIEVIEDDPEIVGAAAECESQTSRRRPGGASPARGGPAPREVGPL